MVKSTQLTTFSLSIRYKFKIFCCLRPNKKENQNLLCIDCLNTHVLLKFIKGYRLSTKITLNCSPTSYRTQLKADKMLDKMKAKTMCRYYLFKRFKETYIGKERKPTEFVRTNHVDFCELYVCKYLMTGPWCPTVSFEISSLNFIMNEFKSEFELEFKSEF